MKSAVRHAAGVAPDGSRYVSPPIILCTGLERLEGSRVAITDDRVTCRGCLKKLDGIPAKARLK